MSADPKVIAAISSAVGFYLQAEQESLSAQPLSRAAHVPVVRSSPFALAGRQAAMNIRWTWQMRLAR